MHHTEPRLSCFQVGLLALPLWAESPPLPGPCPPLLPKDGIQRKWFTGDEPFLCIWETELGCRSPFPNEEAAGSLLCHLGPNARKISFFSAGTSLECKHTAVSRGNLA